MDFRITNDGNQKDIDDIKDMLEAFNTAHGAKAEKLPLGVFYEDEDGNKQAGLIAYIFGNWLFIEFLFVDESLRGQGIGKALVERAEENARRNGCKHAFLSTNGFQAPGFYPKLGYNRVFTLTEFPRDGERYYFTKDL